MLTRLFIAQTNPTPVPRGMSPYELGSVLISTLAFTLFGLLVFLLAYYIMVRAAPFSIRKEIEEDHNTALAIVMGSVIIGIALIISAAIHG
jgi:putative membrane protein